MLEFPVSPPDSPYDFQALVENHRHRLDQSSYDELAILYGLSSLEPFRDEAFCREVEGYLASSQDPVRACYEFAYYLASVFWEYYSMWDHRQIDTPEGKRWEKVKEGEPGYVGDFPDELRTKIMKWLLAGVEAYREDDELMQLIRWLKYRLGMSDTSLTQAEIEILERALGEEIDFYKDKHAQKLLKRIIEVFEEGQKRGSKVAGEE